MSETELRAALIEARDWFESQAKAVSKGCGSSYELHDLRVQRDALDAALAAPAQAVPAPGAPSDDVRSVYSRSMDLVRTFWQQHTKSDALSMTMAELHADVELVIRAARGAAQAQDTRHPLTDEQILSVLDEGIANMGNVKKDAESWAVIVQMTRAIEAAHGIRP